MLRHAHPGLRLALAEAEAGSVSGVYMTSDEWPAGEERFRAFFEAALDAMLVADDERRYIDVNNAACSLLGRTREELLRLRIEDISPMGTDVAAAWKTFLEEGASGGEYSLLRPDGTVIDVEFRAKANVVPGQHLSVLRDITARKRVERELQQVNERLREARERDRRVALTLQQSLLPAVRTLTGVDVATRYRPAAQGIKVCGDWYAVMDLGERCVAVAVGDVVGHGVAAAGAMAQLSSALAAAMHAGDDPAKALLTLDRYARSGGREVLATVVQGVLDLTRRTFTYSSAGHPPPLLLDAAGEPRFLGDATAPPLSVTAEPELRPLARVELPPDATLVLFTDGLVERRTADIDEGLRLLCEVARRHVDLPAETFVSALLEELLPDGAADDVALVVLKV